MRRPRAGSINPLHRVNDIKDHKVLCHTESRGMSTGSRAWSRVASYPSVLWLPCSALLIAILAAGIAWASQTQYPFQETKRARECHCMLGDSCWPSTAAWDQLNGSVGGRLIATQPIGSSCHDPTYNAEKCEYLRKHWTTSSLQ